MKPRRLILEADSSTKSRVAVSRWRPTQEAGGEVNTVREKEALMEKEPWTSEVRSTPVASSWAQRKDKGKAVLTEEVSEKAIENAGGEAYGPQKVASPRTSTGTVILETGEDHSAEEAQSQAFSAADVLCVQACRTAYNAESLRVDELTPTAEKKEQEYEAGLAVKAKKLIECEAVRISDLELIEKLKTLCSELRSQWTQAE
ncbi:hypothetical protein AXG93_1084s1000 [Marchantia polymorpha subsp. ruderalis]|uniref:Uncharacterized protein n=1 Tax=Marchantia polymorpha subsp. ruderalis TaxID=1480154 RepID=A0A176VH77_MARPO|nr:hypothetical protein AXG93_1084s1000 [Marchantia polymorpha subsp. ruderalis]